ncbi:hypothetical protein O6H91_01G069500 [Diphasiastrum complanatum]|uniref:Uncharacterized protein n=2 Tax=Diphasiastrum complanatum TaxID=34168 RepID=A0ACC2ESB0_DIPCM|nr:hypothetical protein O6H91_01G069500 [Diphasiastrum complanatum]KAJ7569274.1 hypothetical protein O6H91_01G069500 [Diphasiastrum complanatum]
MEKRKSKLKYIITRVLVVLLILASSLTILFDVPGSFQDKIDNDLRTEKKHLNITSASYSDHINSQQNFRCEDKILIWAKASPTLSSLKKLKGHLSIGLLNFWNGNPEKWQPLTGGDRPSHFPLQTVDSNLQWSQLFPEWIDEEEEWSSPRCPHIPMPIFREGLRLDMVIARVPCLGSGEARLRDVSRLQLLLAAAHIAIQTGLRSMYVLVFSECRPIPNLFICGELREHHGDIWLYRVDLKRLRRKLELPVGSCELAVQLKGEESTPTARGRAKREAYVTILHTGDDYVCGAIALAQSIRLSGSRRDLIVLVDDRVKAHQKRGLKDAGWKVREIERVKNPNADPTAYNRWNYSKFRLWQLTDYHKVIFLDADLLVLRNLDFLFSLPEISATGNHMNLFNSGVMVIEPSNCTFKMLMELVGKIESYNGGDQGFLNEVYTWWHRLPKHVNFLKHFWSNELEEVELKVNLFAAEPPILYVIHYLGIKPWLCYRDYDCNWNQKKLHEYASDVAHARWWKVHDSMPEALQKQCLLSSKQKEALELDRQLAEADNYEDGHWNIGIKDPRLWMCSESPCSRNASLEILS